MAARSYLYASLLLVLILVTLSKVAEAKNDLTQAECPGQCSRRCSATSHHKPCMTFCQQCCDKCLCVPDGTYGNKETCPCYNNWKTQEGGPKCP